MSFELGVLYVPPQPIAAAAAEALVPWSTPAHDYAEGETPYSGYALVQVYQFSKCHC